MPALGRWVAAGAFVLAGAGLLEGCGTNKPAVAPPGDGGTSVDPKGDGGAPTDGGTGPLGCSDLFDQSVVREFSVDISPGDWAGLDAEFHNLAALMAGLDFATYHPAVVHLGSETVSDAAIKLHGQSSWLDTVTYDGTNAKMQFMISFDEQNQNGSFHGVTKLVFDMPRSDWTFLHDRLAHNWLRKVGIMASCASSARLVINGSYYGLYVLEEHTGSHVVQDFFPSNPNGDLWKGGELIETNQSNPNFARQEAFWNATTLDAITGIVDVPGSLKTWAAEAMINDADGYYGGSHNFYIYDQGAQNFIFLPSDTDSTFDWLGTFGSPEYTDHPVFWWVDRTLADLTPGQHWMPIMSDSGWRAKYAEAIAALLPQWDISELQGWLDTWSAQIAGDVAADPRKWASVSDFQGAVATARDVIGKRPGFLQTFVDCERSGPGGPDHDGDGAPWCADCDDSDPSVHLGAAERCNGKDDNCNGIIDEGCPPPPTPDAGAPPAPDGGAPDGH
jgi:hypothetical protein